MIKLVYLYNYVWILRMRRKSILVCFLFLCSQFKRNSIRCLSFLFSFLKFTCKYESVFMKHPSKERSEINISWEFFWKCFLSQRQLYYCDICLMHTKMNSYYKKKKWINCQYFVDWYRLNKRVCIFLIIK